MCPVNYYLIAAAMLLVHTPGSAHAQSGSLIALSPMQIDGSFLGKKIDKPATDISGKAGRYPCPPATRTF